MPKQLKRALMQPMKTNWPKILKKGHKNKGNTCSGCCVEKLIEEGGKVENAFKALFAHFVKNSKCDNGEYELWGKDDENENKHYNQNNQLIMISRMRKVTGPAKKLKGAERIEQKCNTKYKYRISQTHEVPTRYINDVVRGTMTFKNCTDMLAALNFVHNNENKPINISTSNVIKYKVVRIKQIYMPRSELLYGDVKLNIQLTAEGYRHNCELQLNHLDMIKAKGTKEGHGAYETWRNLDDECWAKYHKELPTSVAEMPSEFQGKAQKAIHASHQAYHKADMAIHNDPKFQAVLNKVDSWSTDIKSKIATNAIIPYDKPPKVS
ncbi:MAG: hypothetical protein MI802_09630 [Desulfobacterales bacterium]|nr:hypothetical protein [Desulfobacterales bacterium]